MSDNPKLRGPADRKRVAVGQPWELRFWTKRFGCTAAELRAAVKRVGPMVVKVRRRLRYVRTGK